MFPSLLFSKERDGGNADEPQKTDLKKKRLIDTRSFNRMVLNDVSYTIFGENTPVSGAELDISKLEGKINFTFPSQSSLMWSASLKAGGTDNNFKVFTGSKPNTAVEAGLNVFYVPRLNKAWFYKRHIEIAKTRNDKFDTMLQQQKDSFYCYAYVFNLHVGPDSDLQYVDKIECKNSLNKGMLKEIVRTIFKNDSVMNVNHIDSIFKFIPLFDSEDKTNKPLNVDLVDKFLELEKRYTRKKRFDLIEAEMMDAKIANVSDFWTKKKNFWVSASPIFGIGKVNLYHQEKDTNYILTEYYPNLGGTLGANLMYTYPQKRVFYVRASYSINYTSNLNSLNDFTYSQITPLYTQGNSSVSKEKTGTAYDADEFKQITINSISGEFYYLPLKSFRPGFYAVAAIQHSNSFGLKNVHNRQNDKFRLSGEIGVVVNVNDKKKEKSVVSLSPYVRFVDLRDRPRQDATTLKIEPRSDFFDRNLVLGFRIGVPINITKHMVR